MSGSSCARGCLARLRCCRTLMGAAHPTSRRAAGRRRRRAYAATASRQAAGTMAQPKGGRRTPRRWLLLAASSPRRSGLRCSLCAWRWRCRRRCGRVRATHGRRQSTTPSSGPTAASSPRCCSARSRLRASTGGASASSCTSTLTWSSRTWPSTSPRCAAGRTPRCGGQCATARAAPLRAGALLFPRSSASCANSVSRCRMRCGQTRPRLSLLAQS